MSLQQDARLHLQREALQQRQAELRSVDQRILELQNRLHKKKAANVVHWSQQQQQQRHGNGQQQQQQQQFQLQQHIQQQQYLQQQQQPQQPLHLQQQPLQMPQQASAIQLLANNGHHPQK